MKIEDLKVGDTLVGKVSKIEYKVLKVIVEIVIIESIKGLKIIDQDQLQGYELKEEYLSFDDLVDGEVYFIEKKNYFAERLISINKDGIKMLNLTALDMGIRTYEVKSYSDDYIKGFKFKLATPEQKELFFSKMPKKVKGFEVGKYDNLICWVWDGACDPLLSLLQSVDDHSEFPFTDYEDISWKNCKPLTKEERKFLDVDSKPIK